MFNPFASHKKVARDFAGDLLPVSAYENGLFYLDTNEMGFGFMAEPLSGADDQTATRLNVLLNQDWPKDTVVSVCMWAGSDVMEHLFVMQDMRTQAAQIEAKSKKDFFMNGVNKEILKGTKLRNMRVYITVKAPVPGHGSKIPPKFIKKLNSLRNGMDEGLHAIGFLYEPLGADDYIRLLQSIFCQGPDPDWQTSHITEYDERMPINEQIFDYDTALEVESDGVVVGKKKIKVLSVKKMPSRTYFGGAMRFLAEPINGGRGIPENCLINLSIIFPDAEKTRQKLASKRVYITHQVSEGKMAKFTPRLVERKEAFDAMFETLDDGDRPMQVYLGLALITEYDKDDEDKNTGESAVANARSFWRESGYQLLEDRYITLPLLLNMLPFGVDSKAIEDTKRFKTMTTRHAVPLLPVFSDWKGTSTPVLNFVSRKGQLMRYDLFDTGSNYNCIIAAQSGSGKSFLTNEIITSYLECGGRAWAIDVGRSYEKLCHSLDGQFLVFGENSNLCINPFDLIQDYNEESDMVVGIVAAMAAPTQPLTDLQYSHLRRIIAEIFKEKGQDTQVDDIAKKCLESADSRVQDIGHQLYAFTSDGEYGRYFNGKNNVKFDADFVVIELEELKSKEHLQQVVLLQMVYQIQQEMYLGNRDRRKLVLIDEAWDLLTKGDIAKFIETGYRRFRKYGGAATVITQSVNDLYEANSGRAIVENSANMLLLGQKKEAIELIQESKRLPLSEFGYKLLKTVHTNPGKYSEIYIISEMGQGVARLVVDEFKKLLYSTKAEDIHAIESHRKRGATTSEAVHAVLRERGLAAVEGTNKRVEDVFNGN